MGFPGGSAGEESACTEGGPGDVGLIPGLGRSHGGGKRQPILVFLPGKSHGPRILANSSPKC